VIDELRDSKSFKQHARTAKQAQADGTTIVASSASPPQAGSTHVETVPERDGGASASTSDSDDM